MAGVHSYDVTLRDEKYSLRQGRGPSYLESWRRSAKEPPVEEGKPLNMSTKRRNAQKGKSVQFPTFEICLFNQTVVLVIALGCSNTAIVIFRMLPCWDGSINLTMLSCTAS